MSRRIILPARREFMKMTGMAAVGAAVAKLFVPNGTLPNQPTIVEAVEMPKPCPVRPAIDLDAQLHGAQMGAPPTVDVVLGGGRYDGYIREVVCDCQLDAPPEVTITLLAVKS